MCGFHQYGGGLDKAGRLDRQGRGQEGGRGKGLQEEAVLSPRLEDGTNPHEVVECILVPEIGVCHDVVHPNLIRTTHSRTSVSTRSEHSQSKPT